MAVSKPLAVKLKLPTRVQPEVMPAAGETGIYTNKIHYLKKYLLDELLTKKFAMDFMEPVDTAVLQVPNYYSIIKSPMDVGTIIKRVQNRYYQCVKDLIFDFRLVISNCFTFNRPGDVVYRNCQKLEKFFQRILNKMPKGEERTSTKDPQTSGKQQSFEKASETLQRQCREQLKMLQASITKEDDVSICKYFNNKCELLSQKVDKHCFKTIEEFHFEVNGIFKHFDNQIKLFYETHHQACEHEYHQLFNYCQLEHDAKHAVEDDEKGGTLDKHDITGILFALRQAECGVEHCDKAYSKENESEAREKIDALKAKTNKLKLKLTGEQQCDEKANNQKNCCNQLQLTPQEANESNTHPFKNLQQEFYKNMQNSNTLNMNMPTTSTLPASNKALNASSAVSLWQMAASDAGESNVLQKLQSPQDATSQPSSLLWRDLQLTSSSDHSDDDESS